MFNWLRRLFSWLTGKPKPKGRELPPFGEGFNPHRVAVLDFSGTEFPDAEVRTRMSIPWDKYLELQSSQSAEPDTHQLDYWIQERLVSWNLVDDDGVPVPATVEGLHSLPLDFIMLMFNTWLGTVGLVDTPLDEASENGEGEEPPEMAPLDIEELELSLANSSKRA